MGSHSQGGILLIVDHTVDQNTPVAGTIIKRYPLFCGVYADHWCLQAEPSPHGCAIFYTKCYKLICGCKYIPICAIDAAIGKSEFTKDRVKNRIMCCNTVVHDFALRDIALLDQRRNDKLEFRRGGQDKGIGVGRTFAFDWSRKVL